MMEIGQKTIWQQAAGDTDRDYADLCLRWGVILNGPANCGPWPECREALLANGWSPRKMTDLRRFAEEMADGEDIRAYPIKSLQRVITFVPQHFGRYEATAAENIAYGNWEELMHKRAQIRNIAQMTEADKLILSMPEQYDTMLGRVFGTFDLSGGQWQTLAITRAFAREACILVLDEPTAHLDARIEYALFQRFRELAKGRTTLLISHRFSTLRMVDRILVLSEGALVEEGSHEELVNRGGHYADLYALHRSQIDPV